uniref:Putative secreted protein n=1 Tax=Corethrella appendiculata TaxID=1370023 RepID=U5ENW2_9DIPT
MNFRKTLIILFTINYASGFVFLPFLIGFFLKFVLPNLISFAVFEIYKYATAPKIGEIRDYSGDIKILKSELARKFDKISGQIINTRKTVVQELTKEIELNANLAPVLDQIEWFTYELATYMDQLHEYSHYKNINKVTFLDFADSIVGHDATSLLSEMRSISEMITSTVKISGKTFMDWYKESLQGGRYKKNTNLSSTQQQTFLQFIEEIFRIEFGTYHLSQFAISVYINYKNGSYQQENKSIKKNLQKQLEAYAKLLNDHMPQLDRIYWKNDPEKHIEGETCFQLNRLIIAALINEKYFEDVQCTKVTCSKYTNHYLKNPKKVYDRNLKCRDGYYRCRKMHDNYEYCLSKDPQSPNMYEYLRSNSLDFGSQHSCSKLEYITRDDCETCLCECSIYGNEEDNHVYLSLIEQLSDIEKNKVIAGLRFRKTTNIISLQILQGDLLPHGQINASTTEWKTINLAGDNRTFQKTYRFSHWNNKLVLRVLDIPVKNAVLTGVKFRWNSKDMPDLAIQYTPVDYRTGLLDKSSSKWFKEETYGTTIRNANLTKSTECKEKSYLKSESGDISAFAMSSLLEDGGQSTVPFFDAQDVVPSPPIALSGAGILLKGAPYCAGFITPIVKTLHESYLDSFESRGKENFIDLI